MSRIKKDESTVMPKVDTFLANAHIITHDDQFHGGLGITAGKVSQVVRGDEHIAAEDTLDVRGKWVMPGWVDSHVHFNEPGRESWEGYAAGTRAAAAGGVTTILEMPFNATPPTSTAERLCAKRAAVQGQCVVDYGQWGGLEAHNHAELPAMHAEGVIAFKAFMCNSGIDFEQVGTFDLLLGMEIAAQLGNVVGVHAENEDWTSGLAQRLQAAGRVDPRAWAESRPPGAELEATQRAIALAAYTGAKLHVVHVTLADGFKAIQAARAQGADVTGETCPHYLALDEDDLARLGPIAKCGPPLRVRAEVDALWREVLQGRVDLIASDHSPCPADLKAKGADDIWQAWGGITGIQTMLPVLLTEGVHRRGLSSSALVRMTSLNPAQRYGLYPHKGHLGVGADADVVVIDPEREWTLSINDLFSKHKQSPFAGRVFKGAVERTLVRGQTVYLNGEITGAAGYGQLVRRRQ